MRIILTVANPLRRLRLENRLRGLAEITSLKTASNLSEAYHQAEHHPPDVVIFSGSVTRLPEFEVLVHLLDALKARIALVPDQGATGPVVPPLLAQHKVTILDETANDNDLFAAIAAQKVSAPIVDRAPAATVPAVPASTPGRFILIGASTGGVDALIKVLSSFPANCPPTLLVQHTGGSFSGGLARLLDSKSPAQVTEAQDGMIVKPGMVILAPGDARHLRAQASENFVRCRLSGGDPVSGHRPSVDILFRSGVPAARRVSAAILTGMGKDGAEGLLSLRKAGARTFAQNQRTSLVYGMPRVASELGAVERQLPLERIGPALIAASAEQHAT